MLILFDHGTPKGFFTVVIPNYSVNCIRVVAHLLRKTLGWVDEAGEPIQERHEFSYREFEEKRVRISKTAFSDRMDFSSVEGIMRDFSARMLLFQLRGNRTVINEEKRAGQEELSSSSRRGEQFNCAGLINAKHSHVGGLRHGYRPLSESEVKEDYL